jgi:hypothetical protein
LLHASRISAFQASSLFVAELTCFEGLNLGVKDAERGEP